MTQESDPGPIGSEAPMASVRESAADRPPTARRCVWEPCAARPVMRHVDAVPRMIPPPGCQQPVLQLLTPTSQCPERVASSNTSNGGASRAPLMSQENTCEMTLERVMRSVRGAHHAIEAFNSRDVSDARILIANSAPRFTPPRTPHARHAVRSAGTAVPAPRCLPAPQRHARANAGRTGCRGPTRRRRHGCGAGSIRLVPVR